MGTLCIVCLIHLNLDFWMGTSDWNGLPEAENDAATVNNSDKEEKVIQGVANYLETHSAQVPHLENKALESNEPILFSNINLSEFRDFAPENREALLNLIMKACQEDPKEFIDGLKNQFKSLSSSRNEERARLLEVAKLAAPYAPLIDIKEILLSQADRYRGVPGTDDYTFGAKALQTYFDLEPSQEKRTQALNRIAQLQTSPN
jgi:hypothetical protein